MKTKELALSIKKIMTLATAIVLTTLIHISAAAESYKATSNGQISFSNSAYVQTSGTPISLSLTTGSKSLFPTHSITYKYSNYVYTLAYPAATSYQYTKEGTVHKWKFFSAPTIDNNITADSHSMVFSIDSQNPTLGTLEVSFYWQGRLTSFYKQYFFVSIVPPTPPTPKRVKTIDTQY